MKTFLICLNLFFAILNLAIFVFGSHFISNFIAGTLNLIFAWWISTQDI